MNRNIKCAYSDGINWIPSIFSIKLHDNSYAYISTMCTDTLNNYVASLTFILIKFKGTYIKRDIYYDNASVLFNVLNY